MGAKSCRDKGGRWQSKSKTCSIKSSKCDKYTLKVDATGLPIGSIPHGWCSQAVHTMIADDYGDRIEDIGIKSKVVTNLFNPYEQDVSDVVNIDVCGKRRASDLFDDIKSDHWYTKASWFTWYYNTIPLTMELIHNNKIQKKYDFRDLKKFEKGDYDYLEEDIELGESLE